MKTTEFGAILIKNLNTFTSYSIYAHTTAKQMEKWKVMSKRPRKSSERARKPTQMRGRGDWNIFVHISLMMALLRKYTIPSYWHLRHYRCPKTIHRGLQPMIRRYVCNVLACVTISMIRRYVCNVLACVTISVVWFILFSFGLFP